MIPVFGDETRRRINLGGASTAASQRDVLRRAREERQERLELRRRQESAIKVQAWWRGINEVRRTRKELRHIFECDPTSLMALRCLVLIGPDDEVLSRWSHAMTESRERLYTPFMGENGQSWRVLLRQALVLVLSAVARNPGASDSISHLNVLLSLLNPQQTQHFLGPQGTQVSYSMIDYLLQHNLYPSLAQAIECLSDIKSSAPFPLIANIITIPLIALPQDSPHFTLALETFFVHILSIPLLPNRLPISVIPSFSSNIPWTSLEALRPSLQKIVQALSAESRIHLISNVVMFASPHAAKLPAPAIGTYLILLATLMNNLPVNALDPEAVSKTPNSGAQFPSHSIDSDEENGTGISVTVVSSFSTPSLPKLDTRTIKRLKTIHSQNHISALFHAANRNDSVLYNYVIFLLSVCFAWPSQKDTILNAIAALGGGAFVRILYRQYVLKSQLGQSNTSLSDPSHVGSWPPLLLLTDLYSQVLLTMGDDEFFSSTGQNCNPLSLDQLQGFSKQLLSIAVTLYWREEYTSPGKVLTLPDLKCPWEAVRDKITRCLVAIHARDSRKPFLPKDHWLVDSRVNLESFVEAAVIEDQQLLSEKENHSRRLSKYQLAQLSPRLGILNNIPFAIPFETRVRIFREFVNNDRLAHSNQGFTPPSRALPSRGLPFGYKTRVQVRRGRVAQDGFDRLSEADLKQPIEITFIDQFGQEEAGIDGGGVFKEFLTSLCKEVFDTDRGLWLANKKQELYPNPHSYATEAHSLDWYRFIGRILGKAMYEGILVDVAFAGFFLAKWLGKQSFLDDLASLDPDLYNGLIFLKHYTGNPEDLSLNFTVAIDDFGITKTIDLIPNGNETPVTRDNRLTYIYLISHYRLSKQIRLQSQAFFEGLSEMIDPKWLRMFNQQEVQILLGGTNSPIDLADWRQHTNYGGLYDDNAPTIIMFWKIANSFNQEQRQALLRFVTSCSRPPLLGFKELIPNFSIRDSGTDELRLPTASTCVNLLKLPRYTSEQTLKEKLLQAINSNAGFDLS